MEYKKQQNTTPNYETQMLITNHICKEQTPQKNSHHNNINHIDSLEKETHAKQKKHNI